MANRRRSPLITDERMEDVTMYGEFISSFDQWITPDKQRRRVRHLENLTEISEEFSEVEDASERLKE